MNVRKLKPFGLSVGCAAFLLFGLTHAPQVAPAAGVGLLVGLVLGFIWPLRHHERSRWLGSGLVLATAGGLLLSAFLRAVIHDQTILFSIGAGGIALIGGWGFVIASR